MKVNGKTDTQLIKHLTEKQGVFPISIKRKEQEEKLAERPGDVSADSSGNGKKMAKRAGRRMAGKAVGRAFRKLFK